MLPLDDMRIEKRNQALSWSHPLFTSFLLRLDSTVIKEKSKAIKAFNSSAYAFNKELIPELYSISIAAASSLGLLNTSLSFPPRLLNTSLSFPPAMLYLIHFP